MKYYNYTTYCYIFITFLLFAEKKMKKLIWGICLLIWGVALGIIWGFEEFDSRQFWFIFGLCFVGGWMLASYFFWKKSNQVKRDEMSKRIGYTSLALSAQLIMLIGGLLILIDFVSPFLKHYSAIDALIFMINSMCLLVFCAWLYYSKYPEKTWL